MIYGLFGLVSLLVVLGAITWLMLRRFVSRQAMKRKMLAQLMLKNDDRGLDATEFGRYQLRTNLGAAMTRAIKLESTPTFAGSGNFAWALERGEFHPMLGMLDYDADMDQNSAPKKYLQMGELALLTDSMEMVDRALAYLESVAPNDFTTLNLRGKALLRRGKTGKAIAVWTKMHAETLEYKNEEYAEMARCNREVATTLGEKLRVSRDASRKSETTRETQNQLKGVPLQQKDLVDKADLETLVNLIDMENRRETIDDMFRAAIDPVPFFADNRERWKDAGFNEAYDMLYAALLPLELGRQGRAGEIDWREDPEEIACSIEKISLGKYPNILTDSDDLPTLEALKLAGRRIRDGGDAMLSISSGGDCYIIFIVPGDKSAAIIAAADKCNITMNLMEDEP